MRLKMMLGEAIRSIGANVSTTVAATMTVLIGMFLLGLFIAFATYAHSWSDHVKDELVVKVFFDRTAVPKNVDAVRIKLESDPRVDKERLQFISAAEGLAKMRSSSGRPDCRTTRSELPTPSIRSRPRTRKRSPRASSRTRPGCTTSRTARTRRSAFSGSPT
jgi:cell division protein FtsX